jgi:hypothetical protein
MSLVWNRSLAFSLADSLLMRVGIHPPDVLHASVWNQIRGIVAVAARSRECFSYEKFIEKFGQSSNR